MLTGFLVLGSVLFVISIWWLHVLCVNWKQLCSSEFITVLIHVLEIKSLSVLHIFPSPQDRQMDRKEVYLTVWPHLDNLTWCQWWWISCWTSGKLCWNIPVTDDLQLLWSRFIQFNLQQQTASEEPVVPHLSTRGPHSLPVLLPHLILTSGGQVGNDRALWTEVWSYFSDQREG